LAAANDILNKIGTIENFENVGGWDDYLSGTWSNALLFEDDGKENKMLYVEFFQDSAEVREYTITTTPY
jgi:hypothetical protein